MLATRARIHATPLVVLFSIATIGCGGGEAATEPETDETIEEEESELSLVDRLRPLVSPAEGERFEENRGLVTNGEGATPGLTMVMPLNSTSIHLVDEEANVKHTWETDFAPGGWCYLMDDGTLYRAGRQDEDPHFKGGGIGGVIERLAPDGKVLWRYEMAEEARWQHHDIDVLPNGNVIFIAWERQSAEEAIARGRDPRGVGEVGLWSGSVYEVRPTPPEGGEIVWSWHAWDHLVQNTDAEKPNYGERAAHPGRFDVNLNFVPPDEVSDEERQAAEQRKKDMAALGYGGGDEEEEEEDGPPPKDWDASGDWMHTNALDHHAGLDLIVLSSPELSEIYVIDHSTTREEARGSTGGRYGRGGDILWRWGNPQNYGAGGKDDQVLYYQHDPQWLDVADGAAPRVLVFNNGFQGPGKDNGSSVLELELPFDADSGFALADGAAFGPSEPAWSYRDPETFLSAFISGASRLSSGNTLICSGVVGRIFEVDPSGAIVWDYYSTLGGDVEPPEHAGKAPPFALYRVARYAHDHPGVTKLR